jgi:hypothetical protein
MMRGELLQIPSNGIGEAVYSAQRGRHGLLRRKRSVSLGTSMTGARVLGPELIHCAH